MSYSLAVPTAFPLKALVVNHRTLARISDLELVQQCQVLQPDAKLFAELIRRHQGQVDTLLYKLAPEWSDRADLSQEVWIRVYRYLHRLQEAEKFRGWLGRIVTNLFCDELRKRKRLGRIMSLDAPIQTDNYEQIGWELPSQLPSPVDKLSTQEFYEKLQVAIADLPESFRQTIILREIQGLSYEEIAELTQVSLGTVKSRIARARIRLQQQLQPYLLDA
ncbi:MAG: sigma-70 family RNA polymerase sigma factor [Pseudanabaenaceae cyanobacterium bins.68]|nr:sigma-70 family RNA polymerase sigma factor [Pseudanabaenaceae cyanobacterium bins.68]